MQDFVETRVFDEAKTLRSESDIGTHVTVSVAVIAALALHLDQAARNTWAGMRQPPTDRILSVTNGLFIVTLAAASLFVVLQLGLLRPKMIESVHPDRLALALLDAPEEQRDGLRLDLLRTVVNANDRHRVMLKSRRTMQRFTTILIYVSLVFLIFGLMREGELAVGPTARGGHTTSCSSSRNDCALR